MSEPGMKWANTLSMTQIVAGAILGAFLGGVGVVAWGDARYANKGSFEDHVRRDAQQQYATESELDAHRRDGHDFTKVQLATIQAQLAAIQTDLVWLKTDRKSDKKAP